MTKDISVAVFGRMTKRTGMFRDCLMLRSLADVTKMTKKKNMELVYVHTNLSSLTQQGHEAMSSSHSLIKDVREKNRRPAKAYRAEHTFTEKHQGTTQTLLSLFTLKISQMLKAGAGQRMEHCVSFSHHSLQRIYELNTSCLSYIL